MHNVTLIPTLGLCVHQWAYMPTTGCMSCVKCREFRDWDDPETVKIRAQYEAITVSGNKNVTA